MRRMIVALVLSIVSVGGVLSQPVRAIELFNDCQATGCAIVKENKLETGNNNAVLKIMQVVLAALGSIAVLMIVIGGIRFVTSQGDPAAVKSAKDTILYAVIGIVVALLASGIVLLVTDYFK